MQLQNTVNKPVYDSEVGYESPLSKRMGGLSKNTPLVQVLIV